MITSEISPHILLIIAIMIGFIAASFLNLLIDWLPKMIQNMQHDFCSELIKTHPIDTEKKQHLCAPYSSCRHCQKTFPWYHQIPLISFLYLKGKCHDCGKKISLQYFWIEFSSIIFSTLIIWNFGFSLLGMSLLLLLWCTISLLMIDLKHFILPDEITLFLLWMGLILSVFRVFTYPEEAIIGAVFGYLILYLPNQLFFWISGKHGIGHGDFKLLAALGAWFGWQLIPEIILVSSLLGLGFSIFLSIKNRIEYKKLKLFGLKIPFGPFLCLGAWYVILKYL